MFSLESFYKILYTNLLKPINGNGFYFSNFGSTNPQDLVLVDDVVDHDTSTWTLDDWSNENFTFALFYDQEPMYIATAEQLWNPQASTESWLSFQIIRQQKKDKDFWLLANSEHGVDKTRLLESHAHLHDWYYFYHGFAALDWFRNCQYHPPIRKFTKVFICFNHLVTKKRSYRLHLIAKLIALGLDENGYISLVQDQTASLIKQEIFDPNSELSRDARQLIAHHLLPKPPKLTIDTDDVHGALSATDDLKILGQGFFHVVTETIYYDSKLHLTEKIFKPIVARRPFILVGAQYNLAYLKSYGFKTFDRWIDESYDDIADPNDRMSAVVNQIEMLCWLDEQELEEIYQEMQTVLEYNFNWFYTGFKQQIVNELVDNFKSCVDQHNAVSNNYVDYSSIDFTEVKKRLAQ
jgi:hypothetical protein